MSYDLFNVYNLFVVCRFDNVCRCMVFSIIYVNL